MSTPRGKGQNGGHFYSNITQPVKLDFTFIVDSANGNGLGVRTIKSNGYVENVFMHTTATPGMGLGGHTNPNPIAGYAFVQFKNNFNYYIGGFSGKVTTLTSSTTTLAANTPYTIISLGTATLAQWQTAGVPLGFTPAVGLSFIASSSGGVIGGGATAATAASGSPDLVCTVDVMGDPNQSISSSSVASYSGAYQVLRFVSFSGTTATPADGTAVSFSAFFDASSVSIPDGGPSNTGTGGL
jgi:hypothetical protein